MFYPACQIGTQYPFGLSIEPLMVPPLRALDYFLHSCLHLPVEDVLGINPSVALGGMLELDSCFTLCPQATLHHQIGCSWHIRNGVLTLFGGHTLLK
jgi:hypothetical protein